MSKIQLYCKVVDGKPQNYISSKLFSEIEKLPNGSYLLEVSPANKRSDKQNRYLHSLFGIFSEELIKLTGDKQYTREIVKEMMKAKFLMQSIYTPQNELTGNIVKHTSGLSKTEMMEFVENIIQYASETFGFNLPFPNEQLTIE